MPRPEFDPTAVTKVKEGWTAPTSEVARRLDPSEMLLRLMAQSFTRAAWLADLIRIQVEREGIDALVTQKEGKDGNPMGEEIRALVRLEKEERKAASDLALKAVAAGIAQRQVELAQREAQIIISAMTKFAQLMGHDVSSMDVRAAISTALVAAKDTIDAANTSSSRVIEGSAEDDT